MTTTPATTANTFLQRATSLVDRGFSVIPLQPRAKNPVGPGATSCTRNLDIISAWATNWPDANAAVCSDGNITILESDDVAKFKAMLAGMGVTLPETLTGGASESRPHYFFKRTADCGDDCLALPGIFEFRNRNQYVVGPGSIHPSGAQYRFWNDVPMVELPAVVINALHELAAGYAGEAKSEHVQPGAYAKLREAYTRLADPADLLEIDGLEIEEGERHYTLMSLAGLLHDGERSADEIAEILKDVRDRYFADGKGDAEIESIAGYVVREKQPCHVEPWDLPSFAHGLIVFKDAKNLAAWLADHQDDFADDWAVLQNEDVPEQEVLIELNGVPLLRREMVSEIFAFRGVGKSMFMGGLVKILTKGGDFLGLTSRGAYRVLLVDGELPKKLLQTRLKDLVGPLPAGYLRVRGLSKTKDSYMAPLADKDEQTKFLARLKAWKPDVIVFDTKTAVFKHDTNDQPQLLAVNEFLMKLRAEGFAVITTHHEGKNGSQRGRTDNDDITDLIIRLAAPKDWTPGDGMQFNLGFEKVRYGDRLEGFGAKWTKASGWEFLETDANLVLGLLLKGEAVNAIAKKLGLGNDVVAKIRKKAIAAGHLQAIAPAGPGPKRWEADKKAEAARLAAEGMPQREIAKVLGISQSTVTRLVNSDSR
jgi:transposase